MRTITGAVEITIDASTVGHLESFVNMCKLAGVPSDAAVQARTAPRRQLRQLGVKADSVILADDGEVPAGVASPDVADGAGDGI